MSAGSFSQQQHHSAATTQPPLARRGSPSPTTSSSAARRSTSETRPQREQGQISLAAGEFLGKLKKDHAFAYMSPDLMPLLRDALEIYLEQNARVNATREEVADDLERTLKSNRMDTVLCLSAICAADPQKLDVDEICKR